MQIVSRISTLIKSDENKSVWSDLTDQTKIISEYDTRQIKIAPATVDADIDLGGVSNIVFLMIIATQPIKCKLNGSLQDTSAGTFFVFTGDVTSYINELSLSNSGLVESNVKIVIGG